MTNCPFGKIIGQEKVKKKLNFFLEGQSKTRLSPHLLFVAPRGSGKTLIAQTYASQLINSEGKKRRLITINCSSLNRLKQFVNDILLPLVVGKEVTILFDEASEIPREISMALLTILNPNPENRNRFTFQDIEIEFDFRNVTFLFATTEPHKLFHALIDRLERIDLEEYSPNNLSTILQKNIGIEINESVLKEIVSTLRGNARQATLLAKHIRNYLEAKNKSCFEASDWLKYKDQMGVNPLGLTPLEIKVLRCLAEKTETTLTNLSAKTQLTREALQRDVELHLQKLNLMEVTPSGRKLTAKGMTLLSELK